MSKEEKLAKAAELLHDADGLIQEALGASEECYRLHTLISNIAEDLEDRIA